MKTLLVLAAFSATILAHPAGKSPDGAELTIVPLERGPFGQPIIDTGIVGGDGGSIEAGVFNDLFKNLAGIMNRIQHQFDTLLGRNGNGTIIENSDFPGFFVPNIDLSKGNTTSVTKKIDGHKVVINQTVYNGDDDGTFFNVRVVEVLPDSSEEKTDQTTLPAAQKPAEGSNNVDRDRESIENSAENEAEILKNSDNIETFDQIDASLPLPKWQQFESLENFNEINDNSIDDDVDDGTTASRRIIDLSRDIYVNDIMADAGVPPDPDAEVFDPSFLPPVRSRRPFEKIVQPR